MLKKNQEEFIEAKSEWQFLNSWSKWWDSQNVFIFSAFTPKNVPKMNLAEVIHAGWSNRDSPNLSLLDAAQIDAKASILHVFFFLCCMTVFFFPDVTYVSYTYLYLAY